MKPARHTRLVRWTTIVQTAALSLVILSLCGCSSSLRDRPVRIEPTIAHNLERDRTYCWDYAQRYGVINLGPLMGGEAVDVPDKRRRNQLFKSCMEEKGYKF